MVSDSYEYEEQSVYVPIVFIGFPRNTSAMVEMEMIKPVVEKIAGTVGEYMRKNTNA